MSETRPTLSERLSKTLTRAKTRGLGEAGGALAGELRSFAGSEGTLEFLARETDVVCPERDDLTFRLATFGDAALYATEIGTDSAATFRARLSDTTWCCLVLAGDRIAHASWVTTRAAWTAELGRVVTPPPGSAYVYESFTAPDLRGRGIYPFALCRICSELATRGITRAWIGVDAANAPSVRAITKAGFESAFSVRYGKRLGRLTVQPAGGPDAAATAELLGGAPPD